MRRHFEPVYDKQTKRHFFPFTCSCGCGETQNLNISTGRSFLPDEAIVRYATNHGWILGKTAAKDILREHLSKRKNDNTMQIVPKVPPANANQESPREPGRDDKRIIFGKLSEVYMDEKTGYVKGWSDQKVATDLGVPRKWVSDIREEMFGSIPTNPEIEDFLAQVAIFERDAKAAFDAIEAKRLEIEKLLKDPVFTRLADFQDRLGKLERLSTEVKRQLAIK